MPPERPLAERVQGGYKDGKRFVFAEDAVARLLVGSTAKVAPPIGPRPNLAQLLAR